MKKYGLLVIVALFFATGVAIGMEVKGKDYVDVYVQNNVGEDIVIGNTIIKAGTRKLLGKSLDQSLVAQIYKVGDTTSIDNQTKEFKETLQKMYLHPGAVLLLMVDRTFYGSWTYTWQWVPLSEIQKKDPATSKEASSLPTEVKEIIATTALKLVLDEAEDKSLLLQSTNVESFKGVFSSLFGIDTSNDKPAIKYLDFIISLLKNGANPNTTSYKGNSLLHLFVRYMAEFKQEQLFVLIELLLKKGVSINARNNEGNTIAHDLIQRIGQQRNWTALNVLRMLVNKYGLDLIMTQNNNGYTPLQLAEKMASNGEWKMEAYVLEELRTLKK